MNMGQGQDWDTVVLRKSKPKAGTVNKDKVVNDALRSGGQVDTVKKFGAGSNKTTGVGKDAAKLDRETEELQHDRVPSELKKRIQQARLEKKLTQAQLGQLINEKPNVIQEYENGKAIPAPAVLSKLSRVLGVQLSAKKK
ncbi:hypothetical protein CVIRNUC_006013 [Coccomyxa viridis]|uniref:HTH cro/C1-type domain-containing protein n=1 Tax=Coccomyxa viridis TaxID=1274662 RepID=A0AAV1IAG1_9CHLO|nr:hypothetical protein CVIRNUC_006013 [Coccomyxa viridis]